MRHPRAPSRQRGSLSIELLLVAPAFILLFLLTQWALVHHHTRGAVQDRAADCALAYAWTGCEQRPPACAGLTVTEQDYGGGADEPGLGGRELIASGETTLDSALRGGGTLGRTPVTVTSRYRVACNVHPGDHDRDEIVRNVCQAYAADAKACLAWQ